MTTDTSKITTAANDLGDGLAKGGAAAKTLGQEIVNAIKSLDSRVTAIESAPVVPPGGGSGGGGTEPPAHPFEDFTKGYYKFPTGTTTFSDNNNTVKCSVSNGSHSEWDATCDFAGVSRSSKFPAGSNVHLDYYFKIEPGDPMTGRWVITGEIHNDDDALGRSTSPPFSVHVEKDIMSITAIAGGTSSSNDQWMWPWKDTAKLERGRDYHMQIDVKFTNTGYLKVKRDGVSLVDYKGNIGYGALTYWVVDIYRSNTNPNTTETTAVSFSRMQVWTD